MDPYEKRSRADAAQDADATQFVTLESIWDERIWDERIRDEARYGLYAPRTPRPGAGRSVSVKRPAKRRLPLRNRGSPAKGRDTL